MPGQGCRTRAGTEKGQSDDPRLVRLTRSPRADVEVIRKASSHPCKHPQKPGDGGRVAKCSANRLWLLGVYLARSKSARSNACYYGADLAALPGRRDGRSPRRRTEQHWMHGFQHLAKVRVAGSNPVVRSKQSPVQPGCAPRLFSCQPTFIARLSRGPDAPTM